MQFINAGKIIPRKSDFQPFLVGLWNKSRFSEIYYQEIYPHRDRGPGGYRNKNKAQHYNKPFRRQGRGWVYKSVEISLSNTSRNIKVPIQWTFLCPPRNSINEQHRRSDSNSSFRVFCEICTQGDAAKV